MVTCRNSCKLDYNKSIVTQAQLSMLQDHYNIPTTITMRASRPGTLPVHTKEDKIPFLTIAFECGLRLTLLPFAR